MDDIQISTYNARGLRHNKKRRQVFAYLHNKKRDIYLIQETHSIAADERVWTNEWGGQIIFCHGSSLSRGVCILLKPSLSFTISNVFTCNNGRVIILNILINSNMYAIVCLYGPNRDDPAFFDFIHSKLLNYAYDYLIIGGDFNFVLNLDYDKIGGNRRTNFNARNKCLDLMSAFDLIDIWRDRNPYKKYLPGHLILFGAFTAALTFS